MPRHHQSGRSWVVCEAAWPTVRGQGHLLVWGVFIDRSRRLVVVVVLCGGGSGRKETTSHIVTM
jgi:hypothetical protein